ncbi:MAG: gamma carbonic anhydrase family protein [Proteobacteria bacterium]|nr:gamma carbonic anhydrase family protein [Pseudomonadota bacterium]
MPLYEFNGKRPVIGDGTWIAPSAEIIGDVKIGHDCYIGFGAIIRADFGEIVIGNETAIEELVMIHEATRVLIGNRVIVGHMAMLHDVVIGDCALIGMQSMLCAYSEIKEWSIVAEQSLVMKNQTIPSEKIYGGSPAKEIGNLEKRHKESLKSGQDIYVDLARQYQTGFKVVG